MNYQTGSEITIQIKAKFRKHYDVIVCGGGTAGCIAAIAAARNGAKTLLIERSGTPGGMMTTGNAGLTKFIVHNRDVEQYKDILKELETSPQKVQVAGGLPLELANRLIKEGAAVGTAHTAGSYVFTSKLKFKWLLLDMFEKANVSLLFFSSVVDVLMENNEIKGVIVQNKAGHEIYTAGCVIDATGDGDVAALAGVPFVMGVSENDLAAKCCAAIGSMQDMGVLFRIANIDIEMFLDYLEKAPEKYEIQCFGLLTLEQVRKSHKNNEMFVFNIKVNEEFGEVQFYNTPEKGVFIIGCPCITGNGLDADELTRCEIGVNKIVSRMFDALKQLQGLENAFIVDCPDLCVRETRHIMGEYILTSDDILNNVHFEDCIGRGCHPIDISPIPPETLEYPIGDRWSFQIPYRCIVPQKVENLLIAGRCISADREASGSTRTTVQCMVTGQAAGTAAALCVKENVTPRKLDSKKIVNVLLEQGAVL